MAQSHTGGREKTTVHCDREEAREQFGIHGRFYENTQHSGTVWVSTWSCCNQIARVEYYEVYNSGSDIFPDKWKTVSRNVHGCKKQDVADWSQHVQPYTMPSKTQLIENQRIRVEVENQKLKAEIIELNGAVAKQVQEMNAVRVRASQVSWTVEAENQKLTQKTKQVTAENKALTRQVAQLKQALTNKAAEVKVWQTEKAKLTRQEQLIDELLSTQSEQRKRVKIENQKQAAEIQKLKAENIELKSAVAKQVQEMNAVRVRASQVSWTVEAENEALTQQVAELKQALTNKSAEIRALQTERELRNNEEEEKKEEEIAVCKARFAEWLTTTVQLKQYLAQFREHECDDIRMVQLLDEDTLHSIIGMSVPKRIHCKFLLEQIAIFGEFRAQFKGLFKDNARLRRYISVFNEQCILTMAHLQKEIAGSKQALATLLRIEDGTEVNLVWSALFPNAVHINSNDNHHDVNNDNNDENDMNEPGGMVQYDEGQPSPQL